MYKLQLIFIIYLLSILAVVFAHELIHWSFAKIFNRKPTIKISKLLTVSICYANNYNHVENLIISSAPSIILFTTALFIPNNSYTLLLKLFAGVNIINFLPFTSDGQVITYSIIKLVSEKKISFKIIKVLFLFGFIASALYATYLFSNYQADEVIEYDDTSPQFIHEPTEEIIKKIETEKPGTYYFGYATCSWCRELLPVLKDALHNNKMQAYVIDTQGKDFVNENESRVRGIFTKYTKEKDLTVPFILHINQNGDSSTHIGTVKGHNAKQRKMTKLESDQLYKQLDDLINN